MGKPSDYTDEEIAAAISDCGGYITGVAKLLDCRPTSLGAYIKTRPELRDLMLDQREEMLDQAEAALAKAVHGEKAWAIQFALSRLGKHRGYGQKIEVEGTGTTIGRVVVYMPDDGREKRAIDGDSTTTGATDNGPSEQG